MNSCFICDTSY